MRSSKDSISVYLPEGSKESLTKLIENINYELMIIRGRDKVSITDMVVLGLHLASNRKIPGLKSKINKNLVQYLKSNRGTSKQVKSEKVPELHLIDLNAKKDTPVKSEKVLKEVIDISEVLKGEL